MKFKKYLIIFGNKTYGKEENEFGRKQNENIQTENKVKNKRKNRNKKKVHLTVNTCAYKQ